MKRGGGAAKGVVGRGGITLRKKDCLKEGGRNLSEKDGDRADLEEKLRAELRGAPAKRSPESPPTGYQGRRRRTEQRR